MPDPQVQKFLDNITGLPTLWACIGNKFVAKEAGKGLSTEDFTSALLTKLNGIAEGAEVNQNAFSSITVGSDTVAAAAKTDSFELAAGTNVALSVSNNEITISATDTTYSDVVADSTGAAASGLMSSHDKYTLDHLVSTGGEPNQDAFSYIKVGDGASAVDIAADSATDTFQIVAGSNVTLTGDATNDKLTISATDTTYNDVVADATGAADSGLMTSADKAKLDGVAAGAQANVLEGVSVNGTALTPTSKVVNIAIEDGTATEGYGHIKVNGAGVEVYGLGTAGAATVETTGVSSDTTTLPTTAQVKAYADGLIASSVTDGDTTHAPSADAVHDAIAAAVASAYEFKGSVADEDHLPASGQSVGDVYNIIAASTYGPAGMNVAWDGSVWDALGASITIEAMTQSEIEAICV